ncbi:hypothetical protein BN1263330100 [Stenotrophomonas maltophilia]|nr:hypothetical protein BN1263330100 [Stenotrophomonas maltophilia]
MSEKLVKYSLCLLRINDLCSCRSQSPEWACDNAGLLSEPSP